MSLLDLFNMKYPSTDFHELNLDWCISAVLQLQKAFEDFSAGNKLIFADPLQHDLSKSYAKNTIVIDASGTAYLSLQAVPKGVQLDNTDYWLPVFDFAGYITRANQNFTDNYFSGTDRTPYALSVGDWVVLDDVLYKVTVAMAADDLFIIGTNIIHFTVEQFLKDFITSVNQTLYNYSLTIQQYKDDIDASEYTYKTELQQLFNQAVAAVTVDSEVLLARVGWDGVTYDNLGDAIRTQISNTYETLYTNNKPVFYNVLMDSSTGKIDRNSFGNLVRLTSQFIPIKNIKFFFMDGSPLYKYQCVVFKYSKNSYSGFITGIDANGDYTWGTSNAMTFAMLNFDKLQKDFPDDSIILYVRKRDIATNTIQNIDQTDVENFHFIWDFDECVKSDLLFENGRLDSSTGLNISTAPSNRLRLVDFIKVEDLAEYVVNSLNVEYGVFLYDENKEFIGIIDDYVANTTDTGGGVIVWNTSFNFNHLNVLYPEYYCKLLIRFIDSSDITPDDVSGCISYVFTSHTYQLEPPLNNLIYATINKQFQSIAYSKISGIYDAPINTEEHYTYCATYNDGMFNALKGDARCTSDGYIVMCHDSGFTLDGNGRITAFDSDNNIPIHSLTLADCLDLEYDTQFNGQYCKVCDLHTFLRVCKRYGKTAYLVIRDEFIDEQMDYMLDCINGLSMHHHIIINSFTYDSLKLVNAADPELMLSWIVPNGTLSKNIIDAMNVFDYAMLTLHDFGGSRTQFTALETYKTNGLIDYAMQRNVLLYEAIVNVRDTLMTTDEVINKLLDYNVTGAQIARLET